MVSRPPSPSRPRIPRRLRRGKVGRYADVPSFWPHPLHLHQLDRPNQDRIPLRPPRRIKRLVIPIHKTDLVERLYHAEKRFIPFHFVTSSVRPGCSAAMIPRFRLKASTTHSLLKGAVMFGRNARLAMIAM